MTALFLIYTAKRTRGSSSYIIVTAENLWPGGLTNLAQILHERTHIECRPVILGRVQRGGSPVSQDRLLATKLGAYGIEMALTGKSSVMVSEQNNQLITHPIERSWEQHKPLDTYLAKIQQAFFDIDNKANPV